MKDKYAILNTHIKQVNGVMTIGNNIYRTKFDVRFTSDERGETLSIASAKRQFTIRFNDILDLIDETRADKKEVS